MTRTESFLLGTAFMASIISLVLAATGHAAVVEVNVHAPRDGYARLHTEGIQVIGCTQADMGRCEWKTGTGLSERTRRVKVHKGSNRIRLKAFRFEDVPAEQLDYGWLRSSNPDDVPGEAAWPTYAAPLNYAYVTGVVAGRELEPKAWKVR